MGSCDLQVELKVSAGRRFCEGGSIQPRFTCPQDTYFYLICMNVLLSCVSAHLVSVWFLQRSEELQKVVSYPVHAGN